MPIINVYVNGIFHKAYTFPVGVTLDKSVSATSGYLKNLHLQGDPEMFIVDNSGVQDKLFEGILQNGNYRFDYERLPNETSTSTTPVLGNRAPTPFAALSTPSPSVSSSQQSSRWVKGNRLPPSIQGSSRHSNVKRKKQDEPETGKMFQC